MGKIKMFMPGKAPAELPATGPAFDAFTERERADLVACGVWSGNPEWDWSRVDGEGGVWAGGGAGLVAKVRGKNGRRLVGERHRLPADQRRHTTSVQLSERARINLQRRAAEEGQRAGRRVTISDLVERWALGA